MEGGQRDVFAILEHASACSYPLFVSFLSSLLSFGDQFAPHSVGRGNQMCEARYLHSREGLAC